MVGKNPKKENLFCIQCSEFDILQLENRSLIMKNDTLTKNYAEAKITMSKMQSEMDIMHKQIFHLKAEKNRTTRILRTVYNHFLQMAPIVNGVMYSMELVEDIITSEIPNIETGAIPQITITRPSVVTSHTPEEILLRENHKSPNRTRREEEQNDLSDDSEVLAERSIHKLTTIREDEDEEEEEEDRSKQTQQTHFNGILRDVRIYINQLSPSTSKISHVQKNSSTCSQLSRSNLFTESTSSLLEREKSSESLKQVNNRHKTKSPENSDSEASTSSSSSSAIESNISVGINVRKRKSFDMMDGVVTSSPFVPHNEIPRTPRQIRMSFITKRRRPFRDCKLSPLRKNSEKHNKEERNSELYVKLERLESTDGSTKTMNKETQESVANSTKVKEEVFSPKRRRGTKTPVSYAEPSLRIKMRR